MSSFAASPGTPPEPIFVQMKCPPFSATKLLLEGADTSPYRAQRRVESDRTPIHKQMFPTKRPLRAGSDLLVHRSMQSVNPVPIHREIFPVSCPPVINPAEWEGMDSDEENEPPAPGSNPATSTLTTPQVRFVEPTPTGTVSSFGSTSAQLGGSQVSVALSIPPRSSVQSASSAGSTPDLIGDSTLTAVTAPPIAPSLPTSREAPSSSASTSLSAHPASSVSQCSPLPPAKIDLALRIQGQSQPSRSGSRRSSAAASRATFPRSQDISGRKEKKIRGLEEYMGWFTSSGSHPLEAPPSNNGAEFGDVFVHSSGGNQVQVWIRTENGIWEHGNAGNDHPYLPGYRLILKNGRPGWVTRKTVATYHYRR